MAKVIWVVVLTSLGLLAFFILFPVLLALLLYVARTVGLFWVNTIGWWWNYWLV